MIVDAHQHFWHYRAADYPWIDDSMAALGRDHLPDELSREMAGHGVNASVVVQACHSEQETRWLLMLAGQHDWIAGVVGWTDLRHPDLEANLAGLCHHARLRGIRHQVESEPDPAVWLDDPQHRRGVRALGRHGLTFDVLIRAPQLTAAANFCTACDNQPLILDHLGKPPVKSGDPAAWQQALEPFRAMEHVTCKLSGLITEADWQRWTIDELRPWLEVALEVFGPDRLMFGSDWPVCRLAGGYGAAVQVVEAVLGGLSASEREAIHGRTAQRVYRLANTGAKG